MEINSQNLLPTGTSSKADRKSVNDRSRLCSSCSSRMACISRDFNERETLQFENLTAGKRRIARNASLYRKHDKLNMLYIVRFGQFKLIGEDLNGEQRVVGFYMAGDLMGMDVIATGLYYFRVVALEDSEVCQIPFSEATDVMSIEPAIQHRFFQAMSGALNNLYSRSMFLAQTSLETRFANFLLTLGEKYSRLGYSQNSFRLSMSRGDIGSYLGTSNESVSRLISRFCAQGAVSIDGRMVELCDRSYLQAMVSGDGRSAKRAVLPLVPNAQGDRIAHELHVDMGS